MAPPAAEKDHVPILPPVLPDSAAESEGKASHPRMPEDG